MKKNINRVMILNILSLLILQGISLISSPLFSRLLGPEGYGQLSSFTVWSSIACTVLSLQTGSTIANARVEYAESEQAAYQSSVVTLSMLSFAAAALLSLLFLGKITVLLQTDGFVVALILIQAAGSCFVSFLSSKFTYEFSAGRNLMLSVGMAAATFGLELVLVLNMPMTQRYLGRILGNTVVYAGVGLLSAGWIILKGRCGYHRQYWRFCLMLSVPLIFQSLSYQLLGNSDIMMLKQMAGASDAGIYSLALTLAGILFTIFTALNGNWIPFYFDDMKEQQYQTAASRAKHFMELFTVLSAGFILLVREVFVVYAPEDYWGGADLLPIFSASYYVNFLNTFPVTFETFHKKTGVVAGATIAAALINLGLNYTLIRRYGAAGAAAATLLSHMIQFGMHELYTRIVLKDQYNPLGAFVWLKYSAVFTASLAAFYLLPSAWMIRWGIGAFLGLWEAWRILQRKSLI